MENGLAKCAESVHNLRWFQVVETRGSVAKNKVDCWQVTLEIGFTLDS